MMNTLNTSNRPAPICGILSVALTPLALLFAFLATALIEALVGRAPHGVGRAIVLLSLACSIAGMVLGIASLVRRERFPWLPAIGWVSTISILG
jgi:hypothetical protein